MTTFIAMLRGINVGGKTLKMEQLRQVCSDLGLENPRTYIQSGNVVFGSDRSPSECAESLEQRLLAEAGFAVSVIVRSASQLGAVIAANPFLKKKGVDRSKLHVTFLGRAANKKDAKILAEIEAGDEFQVAGKEVYLHCPNGYGNTKLSNTAIEKRLATRATTRNWNSVNKLYEMATDDSQ